MNCFSKAIELFQGESQCAAIVIAVAAFVLGLGAAFVVMCVVRKRRNKDAS